MLVCASESSAPWPVIGWSCRQTGIGPAWRQGGIGPSRLEEGPGIAAIFSFIREVPGPGVGGDNCRLSTLNKILWLNNTGGICSSFALSYLAAPSDRSWYLPPPIKSGSTVKLQLKQCKYLSHLHTKLNATEWLFLVPGGLISSTWDECRFRNDPGSGLLTNSWIVFARLLAINLQEKNSRKHSRKIHTGSVADQDLVEFYSEYRFGIHNLTKEGCIQRGGGGGGAQPKHGAKPPKKHTFKSGSIQKLVPEPVPILIPVQYYR
jgi:hypothetical protein